MTGSAAPTPQRHPRPPIDGGGGNYDETGQFLLREVALVLSDDLVRREIADPIDVSMNDRKQVDHERVVGQEGYERRFCWRTSRASGQHTNCTKLVRFPFSSGHHLSSWPLVFRLPTSSCVEQESAEADRTKARSLSAFVSVWIATARPYYEVVLGTADEKRRDTCTHNPPSVAGRSAYLRAHHRCRRTFPSWHARRDDGACFATDGLSVVEGFETSEL